MKRVLFIADMNEIVKNMNEELLPFFRVQLSNAEQEMTEKLLHIYQPDIILVFLNQLKTAQMQELKIVLEKNEKLPVVMVGSMYEFREYGFEAGNVKNIRRLVRPVGNQEVIRLLCEILVLDYKDYEGALEEKEDRRKHILFVDDNPLLLRSMKTLVGNKYRVSIAVSASQAFELMQKDRPDLIFLDCEMPVIDGKMMLQMMRAKPEYAEMPVVFLSGIAEKEYIKKTLLLKPADYVLKPAKQERIFDVLEKHLG